jgi:hypothetical protein
VALTVSAIPLLDAASSGRVRRAERDGLGRADAGTGVGVGVPESPPL